MCEAHSFTDFSRVLLLPAQEHTLLLVHITTRSCTSLPHPKTMSTTTLWESRHMLPQLSQAPSYQLSSIHGASQLLLSSFCPAVNAPALLWDPANLLLSRDLSHQHQQKAQGAKLPTGFFRKGDRKKLVTSKKVGANCFRPK